MVDAYSRLPKLHGLFTVSTKSIISALRYVQNQLLSISEITNVFMTHQIQSDFGSVFKSDAFQKHCLENQFKLTLVAPKYLEMNSIL